MTRKYLKASGHEYWQNREIALKRDDYKCQAHTIDLCDEQCDAPVRKLTCHHIKMRFHGGTHDPENLITLCYKHHAIIHPWMIELPGTSKMSVQEMGSFEWVKTMGNFQWVKTKD